MHVDRLLDAAIISTASVLLVGIFAMVLFAATAALERYIDQPIEQPPLLPASDPPAPTLFDQDAIEDQRQAS